MKQAIFLICGLCAVAMVVVGGGGGAFLPTAMSAAPPSQTVTGIPFYRLVHHKNGLHFYTADANERDAAVKQHGYLDGNDIVAYVLPKPAHGTVALYRLSAVVFHCYGTEGTAKFFYTTSKGGRNKAVAAGWHLDGVVGYVAPPDRGLPGTTPLHQMYNDLSACEKKSAIQVFNLPDRERAHVRAGDDNYFYTTSDSEKQKAISQGGYQSNGVTAYVWPAPAVVALHAPAEPLPDLAVPKVFTEETSVKAIVLNQGKLNVSSVPGVSVRFLVSDREGKVVFQSEQKIGGISPGQSRPVTFDTAKLSTVGLRYRVVVDPSNSVREADELNNASADTIWGLRIKTDPNAASRVPAPTIAITGKQATGNATLPTLTTYTLVVQNWSDYKPEWYQSLKNVTPPAKCGKVTTDARVLVYVSTLPNVSLQAASCKPVTIGKDLGLLELRTGIPLKDTDRLQVTLVDRLTDTKYVSEPYAVGWFALGDVLKTVGCKYLLGRAGSYVCTTDNGMAACENLRLKGKPIQCMRAGKKAN